MELELSMPGNWRTLSTSLPSHLTGVSEMVMCVYGPCLTFLGEGANETLDTPDTPLPGGNDTPSPGAKVRAAGAGPNMKHVLLLVGKVCVVAILELTLMS